LLLLLGFSRKCPGQAQTVKAAGRQLKRRSRQDLRKAAE
jgi:uncharacterized membrane protein